MPTLSIVIPHWPLDEDTGQALRRCVASFPPQCERIVVVNDGTGYRRNVNIGLRLATGEYIAVVNNDCRLEDGDVHDLCVAGTVTSPLVIGERQGLGESIEPGGFHGSHPLRGLALESSRLRCSAMSRHAVGARPHARAVFLERPDAVPHLWLNRRFGEGFSH